MASRCMSGWFVRGVRQRAVWFTPTAKHAAILLAVTYEPQQATSEQRLVQSNCFESIQTLLQPLLCAAFQSAHCCLLARTWESAVRNPAAHRYHETFPGVTRIMHARQPTTYSATIRSRTGAGHKKAFPTQSIFGLGIDVLLDIWKHLSGQACHP